MTTKNERISESWRRTRLKRLSQQTKTYELKVQTSALSREQKESLMMFFVETKRVYNHLLSEVKREGRLFNYDYKKLKDVVYLDKDRNPIEYKIQYIGSSILQDQVRLMQEAVNSLSSAKKNGLKVGALKYKSDCKSIRFIQYGITHKITGPHRIKIQGIKKPLKVNGLDQIPEGADLTTMTLNKCGDDYYIRLTCFIDKVKEEVKNNNIIGIDLGYSTTLTCSDGSKYDIKVGETGRLKGLQAKLAGQSKRSNNWYKTRNRIQKEHRKIDNQKRDSTNKVVHNLLSNNGTIVMQDEQIGGWKETDSKFNKRAVQHSSLGSIKTKLKSHPGVVVLDKWLPTTKRCHVCRQDVDIKLSDRTFKCPYCGTIEDRDVHSAINMIVFYKEQKSPGTDDSKGAKCPEKKPAAEQSYKQEA